MGGAGSRYKLHVGSQVPIPTWLTDPASGDSSEFTRINLESFELHSVIGKGKFGLVYYAQHKPTTKYVAIKFISKKILFETKGRERTQQEIAILKMVSHPLVITYLGGFECAGAISLVFEYAPGGELFTRMKRDGNLKEQCAKFYFCEIACAIGYLHSLNIAYRDLKPENVLIHATGHIKLCDFGFATVIGATDLAPLHDGCGTAMYVAPEIAGGHMKLSHGLPVDWWSLGCILYEMIVGEAPFGDTDKMSKFEIFNNINGAQVSFPLSIGGNLKSMIKGLLEKNQQQRFSYAEVKMNAWATDVDWEQVNSVRLTPPWIPPNCQSPNKSHFVDWPGDSYPTSSTSNENHYCSSFDLSHGHPRTRSKLNSDCKSSLTLESWKSDAASAPAPRLSEARSKSSSRVLDPSHPGNKSRSKSNLETGVSAPSPNRRKTHGGSDAAKRALNNDDDEDNDDKPRRRGSKLQQQLPQVY